MFLDPRKIEIVQFRFRCEDFVIKLSKGNWMCEPKKEYLKD